MSTFLSRDALKLCISSLPVYVNCEFSFVFVDVSRNHTPTGHSSSEAGGTRTETRERAGRF